jgi:hypothetical protein
MKQIVSLFFILILMACSTEPMTEAQKQHAAEGVFRAHEQEFLALFKLIVDAKTDEAKKGLLDAYRSSLATRVESDYPDISVEEHAEIIIIINGKTFEKWKGGTWAGKATKALDWVDSLFD